MAHVAGRMGTLDVFRGLRNHIVWCSPSRRFPRPLQAQGPADPGPARCWTPQEKHVTESDPNRPPSLCKGRKGGPVLAPAYCSSLLDLVYNNSLGRLASHAAHQVRPANVPRYSAL
jgi:hypothetical protein